MQLSKDAAIHILNEQVLELSRKFQKEEERNLILLKQVTLDREIAEERCEGLELELEQLKGKLSILEVDSTPREKSQSNSDDAKAVLEQNEKLKEALMKLRDLTVAEKQDREKKIKELERENKKLPALQGKK